MNEKCLMKKTFKREIQSDRSRRDKDKRSDEDKQIKSDK